MVTQKRLNRARYVIVLLTFISPFAAGIFSFGVGEVNNDEHQEHVKHNLHACREAEEQWKESLNLSAEYTLVRGYNN